MFQCLYLVDYGFRDLKHLTYADPFMHVNMYERTWRKKSQWALSMVGKYGLELIQIKLLSKN